MQPSTQETSFQELELGLSRILQKQRDSFRQQGIPDLATRIDRVDRCVDFMVDNQDAIVEAVSTDFKHKPASIIKASEFIFVINHAKHIKKNLKKWMRDEIRRPDFPFNLIGAKTYIRFQPLGVIGVMVPWNGPLVMGMVGAMDAFSAGNRVMLKVSEFSPATAQLMADLLPRYFDETELAVVTGELEVSQAFAALPFDHLMYTGSAATAKHIMAAAARNLVPVTLELGGKSPVIVSQDADLEFAARRTASGRLVNSGQVCIGPDYVLLPDAKLQEFSELVVKNIKSMFPVGRGGQDYTSIATDTHYSRMVALLDEARSLNCEIIDVPVGADPAKRQFNPAIVINPPQESRLMREEVFGPIIILKSYDSMQDAINFINEGQRPLALYYFGKNDEDKEHVLNHTWSGGVAINEVLLQLGQSDLPFGGIGYSGTGSYWGGDAGFRRFSHARSIFEQGWYKNIASMLDPPYGKTIEKILKMQVKKTRSKS